MMRARAYKAGSGGRQSVAQRMADIIRRPVIASSGLVKVRTNQDKSMLTEVIV